LGLDGGVNAISSSDPDHDWALSAEFLRFFDNRRRQVHLPGGLGIDKRGAAFIALEKALTTIIFIAGTDKLWKTTDFSAARVQLFQQPQNELAATALALPRPI
jgi:hypothetical protein